MLRAIFGIGLFLGGMALAFARGPVILGPFGELSILADKSYREGKSKIFKAVGNVIITSGAETLYGEAAEIDPVKGKVTIDGKVRFTTKSLSMHGSKLLYNTRDRSLKIFDARVFSDSFSLHGKYIERRPDDMILGRNAEYSTCRGCPESWSIYGGLIKITPKQYITIEEAVFKVRGLAMTYLPYFIFPIKEGRSTGLLFPKVYHSSTVDGVNIKLPFFWAIDPSQDMTLTPALFGNRGMGGEFEYRSLFGHDKWLRLQLLDIFDRKYLDNNGQNRYFAHYEHGFRWGHRAQHRLTFNHVGEKDIVRDLDREIEGFYYGNELGVEGFWEWKNDLLQVTLASYFMDNLIVDDPKKFNHDLVQVLPRIGLSATPFNVIKTDAPFFNSLTIGFQSELTNFKQNRSRANTAGPIRNALRFHMDPYMDLALTRWGPVKLNTRLNWDYQSYLLPKKKLLGGESNRFEKWAALVQNELAFGLGRTYGFAYQTSVPASSMKIGIDDEKKSQKIQILSVIYHLLKKI